MRLKVYMIYQIAQHLGIPIPPRIRAVEMAFRFTHEELNAMLRLAEVRCLRR